MANYMTSASVQTIETFYQFVCPINLYHILLYHILYVQSSKTKTIDCKTK